MELETDMFSLQSGRPVNRPFYETRPYLKNGTKCSFGI